MAFLSQKLPWDLAQTKWSSILNPIIALPILNGNMITDISLVANTPKAINHLLTRMPQGWFLTDLTSETSVWRTKPFTEFAITLEAGANTTVSIWVF